MDTQEDYPGYMILEDYIAEEDEIIVIDRYLDHSFYIMAKKHVDIQFHVECFK